MLRLKIFLVAGARPNFMKIAPIFRELKKDAELFEPVIVHTGQHYDEKMSRIFFEDLELPKPHIYLGVGSGTHATQTAEIMRRFEAELLKEQPHLILVVGDVNSTIACSLTASKIRYQSAELAFFWQKYEAFIQNRATDYPVMEWHRKRKRSHACPIIGHVEAGLRSFDLDMPEEINRMETDLLSDLLFTTCRDGDENLIREGTDPRKIFFVGNVMIDSLIHYLKKAESSPILQELNRIGSTHGLNNRLKEHNYALVTLHRPSNVDDPSMLTMILRALMRIGEKLPIVFPMHPRTKKLVDQLPSDFRRALDTSSVLLTEPIGYLDFLYLQKRARLVLTDSGGVQEETSYLGVPCLTLRPNTERPVTITEGTNRLVELTEGAIVDEVEKVFDSGKGKAGAIQYWDGRAAKRIVGTLRAMFFN